MKRPLLLASLMAIACRRPTPPLPTHPPDARAPTAASLPVDAAPPDAAGLSPLCQRLVAAGQSDVAHARSVVAGFRLATVGRFDAFAQCVASPNGSAWVLTLDEIARRPVTTADDPLVATGRWSLAHITPEGERVSVRPVLSQCGTVGESGGELTIQDDESTPFGTRFPRLGGFDYDHDGEAEVFLRFESNDQGIDSAQTPQRCGKLWTFRGGSIAVYAPAGPWKLEDFRDMDRDGRPEVTSHVAYVGSLEYGETTPPVNDELGPEVVMHSLPDGTFSMTDGFAVSATRRRCDALEADHGYGLTLPRVACARMRGRTASQVLQEVARCCNDGGDCGADFCNNRREIRRWTAIAPPANLSP